MRLQKNIRHSLLWPLALVLSFPSSPSRGDESMRIAGEFSENHIVYVGDAKVSYYKAGSGPALVLIHGFPLDGRTWRKVVPELARSFTCYAFDVIGFGNSESPNDEDYTSQGQARVLQHALDALGVSSFALLGNDSGGWIARELALLNPARVTHLILTDTEIPGHRPKYIPTYQWFAQTSDSVPLFEGLLGWDWWRRSRWGFGRTFQNLDLIDREFYDLFVRPMLTDQNRIVTALRFLRNMDFKRVDGFAQSMRELKMPVLLLWGEADPVFPISKARAMLPEFGDPGRSKAVFGQIPHGKLYVQEEFPDAVAAQALHFLKGSQN